MKLALDLGAVWEHRTMPKDRNSKNHFKSFQAVLSVRKGCLRREWCRGKNNNGNISLKPYAVCLTITGPSWMWIFYLRMSNQYSKSENVENVLPRTGIISEAKRDNFMLVIFCLV